MQILLNTEKLFTFVLAKQSQMFYNQLMSPRGAPKGNTNALKHGFYSRQFRKTETDDLAALTEAGLSELASEISLLRVTISRTLNQAGQAEHTDEPPDWIAYLSAMGLAATRIATLLKTQKILEGDQAGVVQETLMRAFTDIAKEMNLG